MIADRLLNLPGTLTRVTFDGAADDYNTPTETTETASVRCWHEQVARSEDTVSTNQQAETHRLYFRRCDDPTGWDRLTVSGLTFQIVGPPWPARNPRTCDVSHWEAHGRVVV